jgi:Ca2+-binding EF-hand superfamily protein
MQEMGQPKGRRQ